MIRGTKRPRVKAIELIESKAQKIDAKLNVSIHNRFDIEVIDAKTGEIRQRAQAENVICNRLWTRLLTPARYFSAIHYGTGSGTPSASDTSLFSFLGAETLHYTNGVFTIHAQEGYCTLRRSIRLSELTAVGSILTEVGIGFSTAASSLVTHAMLKDMNGNTITIEKLSTDIINIYATVFVHWDTSGYNNIFVVPHSAIQNNEITESRGFLIFLAGWYDAGYSDNSARPPSAMQLTLGIGQYSVNTAPVKSLTVTPNVANKTFTLSAVRLSTSEYNLHGLSNIILYCKNYNPSNNPADPALILAVKNGGWFEGSSIIGEGIGSGDGTTLDFTTAFSYPTNCTVYVNGVAQTAGVTVISSPFFSTDMGAYFESLNIQSTPLSLLFSPGTSVPSTTRAARTSGLWYNPNYLLGISSFECRYVSIQVSNDLENWITLAPQVTTHETITVPTEYQKYKFWRTTGSSPSMEFNSLVSASPYSGNIHFDTPPAAGAVITADYTTKTIAKDENHVFDLTVTIQLGEYTE